MNTDILKTIVAYWCHYVGPLYIDRFAWAWDQVELDKVNTVGKDTHDILLLLASTALNERSQSYFAAGALETYINLIIQQKDHEEAAFILESKELKPCLQYTWADTDELKIIAKVGTPIETTDFELPLRVLTLKEVVGFWSHIAVSKVVDDYEMYYSSILGKLLSDKTRDPVMEDLLNSSPDEGMSDYLKENIFVIRDL